MKGDGQVWWPHPTKGPDVGMWCPVGWEPDWVRGHPVIEVRVPGK